jgi:hypothetical protein
VVVLDRAPERVAAPLQRAAPAALLPPIDLAAVPVVLPAVRGQAVEPHHCGGRYRSSSLVSTPVRLLDSAAAIGIDRDGERLIRMSAAQIDLFDGERWQRVADLGTVPPGAATPFTQLLGGWIEDGAVVFRGVFEQQFGIFHWRGGVLTKLAVRGTVAPGGSASFTELGLPSLADGTVWFWAEAGRQRDQSSLYSWRAGTLAVRVSPGVEHVRVMGTPTPRGGMIIFSGNSGPPSAPQGIYALGHGLQLLVPPSVRAPDGASVGPLILGEAAPYHGGLLFVADVERSASRRGMWYAESQAIYPVVDPSETIVAGLGRFWMVAAVGPFVDADTILFQAHSHRKDGELVYGLYALRGCTVYPITVGGDVLDGHVVKHVAHMNPQAVAGGVAIYPVVFTDGAQASYAIRLR